MYDPIHLRKLTKKSREFTNNIYCARLRAFGRAFLDNRYYKLRKEIKEMEEEGDKKCP